jgi:ACS family hexuronate transporter-like MFS transporter
MKRPWARGCRWLREAAESGNLGPFTDARGRASRQHDRDGVGVDLAHTDLSGDDRSRPGPGSPTAESPARATRWAWGVCWLMFASTVLNYMDRQKMSLVSEPIMKEFHLDEVGFGWLISAFLLTYAVCQLPAGYLVDRWDVRKTYAGAVAWWSFAGVAAAFSPTLGVLIAFRIMLGMGESFNWPCALRTTSQVLPPRDRSLGNGIFNSGAAVGAVLTPPLVTTLTLAYNWRVSFAAVGLLGFVWVAVWLRVMGSERGRAVMANPVPATRAASERPDPSPTKHLADQARLAFGAVAATALAIALGALRFGAPAIWWGFAWLMFGTLLAARLLPEPSLAGADWARSLGVIVRSRRFWVLVLVSVTINICWHSLINWLPTYLKRDRQMTFLASGLWSAVPFIAADVGNLGGGWLSRVVAGRGVPPARARMVVMTLFTLLTTTGVLVGRIGQSSLVDRILVPLDSVMVDLSSMMAFLTRNPSMVLDQGQHPGVIILLGLMAMGTAAFMANYFAFTQEVSTRHTGLIVGILGGLGNLAAAGFIPLAGWIKLRTGGFGPAFVLMGLFPFLGLGALLLGWGSPGAADGASTAPKSV